MARVAIGLFNRCAIMASRSLQAVDCFSLPAQLSAIVRHCADFHPNQPAPKIRSSRRQTRPTRQTIILALFRAEPERQFSTDDVMHHLLQCSFSTDRRRAHWVLTDMAIHGLIRKVPGVNYHRRPKWFCQIDALGG